MAKIENNPGPLLLGHANNQFLNCSVDPWPAWASMLRAIEFASDEPSIPDQNGIRQGSRRHFAERLAAQSTANLTKLISLRVRELQPPVFTEYSICRRGERTG